MSTSFTQQTIAAHCVRRMVVRAEIAALQAELVEIEREITALLTPADEQPTTPAPSAPAMLYTVPWRPGTGEMAVQYG